MNRAVDLLNEGKIPEDKLLLGEVFTIDDFDEAMQRLKREHPDREGVRVTLKYE